MDIDRGEIIGRLFVWLGLLASFILLVVAFSMAFASGFDGESTPTSVIGWLCAAAVTFLLSLVPLFHRTPLWLKVFGAFYLLVVSAWIFPVVW